jgi:hypothetical protein
MAADLVEIFLIHRFHDQRRKLVFFDDRDGQRHDETSPSVASILRVS